MTLVAPKDHPVAGGEVVRMPERVWLRIAGGGVTWPSGQPYTTLVGDDRELPKHVEYVRADKADDLLKALEEIADGKRIGLGASHYVQIARAALSARKTGA